MSVSASYVKTRLSPERYYGHFLKGSFGKPTGGNWFMWNGLCPFHADRRAGSLVINKASGAYYCFSCAAKGGDIIAFHMLAKSITFKTALEGLGRLVQCGK